MRLPQDRILHIDIEFENGKVSMVSEWQGELVRCKNCEYMRIADENFHFCDRVETRWFEVDLDDFCSRARMKGGGE